jgi:hypothetical protein
MLEQELTATALGYNHGAAEGGGLLKEEPMSSEGLVTHWIARLTTGDQSAAQHLWEGYFQTRATS